MKLLLVMSIFSVSQVIAQTNSTTGSTVPTTILTSVGTSSSSAASVNVSVTASVSSSSSSISGVTTLTSSSGTSTVSQSTISTTTTANKSSPATANQDPIITQNILTTTVSPSPTCQCVTTGFCEIAGGVSRTDGAGKLNLRLANSVSSNVSQSGTSNQITSPASTGIKIMTSPPKTCDMKTERCCTPTYKCGLRFPPVRGSQNISSAGVIAPFGAYPWHGIIFKGSSYITSGALIDQWNFITTARSVKTYIKIATQLKIRMGEWNVLDTSEPLPYREFQVERITIHPNYNEDNSKNNIAIVKLRKQVNLGEFPTIGTVCLPSSPITSGLRCWASRWTYVEKNVTKRDFQRQVDLPLVDYASCEAALNNTDLGPKFILDESSFICAGGEEGKDICTGESNPLVCQVASQFYLTGLPAWGMGCGKKGLPGIYVNVQNFVPWIQSIITPKT